VIKIATYMFGSIWRDRLAEALVLDRLELVRLLAADAPISQEVSSKVIKVLALHLDAVDAELEEMRECVRQFNLKITEVERGKNRA